MAEFEDEIRIAKNLCERVENPWKSVLEVRCPSDTQLAGYKIDIPVWLINETAEYFAVVQPRKHNFVFEAVKVEREPGKRYSRPKLSFDELKAVFAEHSKQFDYDLLPQALVFLKDYANNHRRTAGTVEGTRYCVGGTDGTWFYDGENRRRLGTHGAVLVKMLEPEEVQPMQTKVARFEVLDTCLHLYNGYNEGSQQAANSLLNCLTSKKYFLHDFVSSEALTKAAALVSEVQQILAAEVLSAKAEHDELEAYFQELIDKKNTEKQTH